MTKRNFSQKCKIGLTSETHIYIYSWIWIASILLRIFTSVFVGTIDL